MCLVDWLRGSGEKIKDLTKGGKKNNPNCPSRIRHVENLCFCVSILKNITGPCLHSITRHPLSSTCKVTKTACSGDEPKDRAPFLCLSLDWHTRHQIWPSYQGSLTLSISNQYLLLCVSCLVFMYVQNWSQGLR